MLAEHTTLLTMRAPEVQYWTGRCTVRRLMREMGLTGAVPGHAGVTTTQTRPDAGRPPDLVERNFTATRPNQLSVPDFKFVATWRGLVYLASVIDVAPGE